MPSKFDLAQFVGASNTQGVFDQLTNCVFVDSKTRPKFSIWGAPDDSMEALCANSTKSVVDYLVDSSKQKMQFVAEHRRPGGPSPNHHPLQVIARNLKDSDAHILTSTYGGKVSVASVNCGNRNTCDYVQCRHFSRIPKDLIDMACSRFELSPDVIPRFLALRQHMCLFSLLDWQNPDTIRFVYDLVWFSTIGYEKFRQAFLLTIMLCSVQCVESALNGVLSADMRRSILDITETIMHPRRESVLKSLWDLLNHYIKSPNVPPPEPPYVAVLFEEPGHIELEYVVLILSRFVVRDETDHVHIFVSEKHVPGIVSSLVASGDKTIAGQIYSKIRENGVREACVHL